MSSATWVEGSLPEVLAEASSMLSGLSSCAGLVLAPKTDRTLKHIEFVNLGPGRGWSWVTEDGLVENRVLEVPLGMPASTLQTASNFLNAKLIGRTLDEARKAVTLEMDEQKTQLDELSSRVVEAGLATWAGSGSTGHLIVRGQAKLLDDVTALSDLGYSRPVRSAGNQGSDASACWTPPTRPKACRFSSARRTRCSATPVVR